MPKIMIDDEFKNLLPPLSPEERAALRVSLQLNGCMSKLVFWDQGGNKPGILLEGHNRREICTAERIPFDYTPLNFPSRELAMQWIIDNQLGRRNLTDERRAYYIGKEYLSKRQPHGDAERLDSSPIRQSDGLGGETAEQVAARHNVSPRTVERDAEFAQAVDALPPKEKEKVLTGQSGKTKAKVIQEAKSNFCDRCQRLGPVKNCAACAAIKPPKPKTKKKSGSEKWSLETFKDTFGKMVRQMVKLATAYESKESADHKKADALLNEFHEHVTKWHKKLMKE